MDEQERIFDMQRHSAVQDTRISNLETKFEMFIAEMKDFKQEMRNRDNQRAEDIREIRQSLQGLQTSGRNLNIAVIVGIAAMVLAVLLK